MIAWKVQNPKEPAAHKRKIIEVNVDDLVEEVKSALENTPNKLVTIDFSQRQLQPPLLLEFIERLKGVNELFHGKSQIILQLYENRLGLLSKENFESIFEVVKAMPNLVVFFGYEVDMCALDQAVKSTKIPDRQIDVDIPRQAISLALSFPELKKKIESHDATVAKTLEHECILAFRRMRGFSDICVEKIGFNWNSDGNKGGELDGYVVGKYRDRHVVVFIECKKNITGQETSAAHQLINHYMRWDKMKDDYENGNPVDLNLRHAYDTLEFEKYKDYGIMFAVGSSFWHGDSETKIYEKLANRNMPLPWFKIFLDGAGLSTSIVVPDIAGTLKTDQRRPGILSKFCKFFFKNR